MEVSETYTVLLFTLLIALVSSSKGQMVPKGDKISCYVEGATIDVGKKVDKAECFKCVCKNGFVFCDGCPSTEGCHMIVEDQCCKKKCKGCFYENKYHPSDSEWVNPKDPCTVMRCEAGIITMSQLRCHTPCSNPLPPEPGKCCPTCSECKMNDQIVTDDRDVISDDPCLKCRCTGGRMICAKKACPVLQCSPKWQIHPPGECCPKCHGTRALFVFPNTCMLQSKLSKEGDSVSVDRCTNCTCHKETSVCKRFTCPILDCAPELQKNVSGSCCKKCELPEEFKSDCYLDGKLYQDGEQWKLDECKSCICQRGITRCAMTRCNTTSTTCTHGTKFQKLPGECCPRCVELERACMVFGDPHYKTFDGIIYTFEGIGKYQLVADCHNHTFFVRVANTVVDGSSSSTRRVSIKYLNARLNLQQRGRIKFNGTVISPPFKIDGKFRIEKNKENAIEIVLNNGLKVFWNFKSFVEVTAPASLKNKVCGLCGNFSFDDGQDDLTTKAGKVVSDKEILAFGASWCLGKKTECAKKIKPQKIMKPTKKNACKFFSTDIFAACNKNLNYRLYFKACKMDMEHCKGHKCYCDSMMAYARECERHGVSIPNWQNYTLCDYNNLRSFRRRPKRPHKSRHSQEETFLLKHMPKVLHRPRNVSIGFPLT